MSSIFDGVIGDLQSFGDALAGSLSNTGGAGKGGSTGSQSDATLNREFMLERNIDRNKTNEPYGPSSFRAGKSDPAQQVNSDVINQQWLQRLNRYASIPQVEGAQAKKAY